MNKRTYQKPETTGNYAIVQEILASSYVSVGGTGNFDVKEDNSWDDIWKDEE